MYKGKYPLYHYPTNNDLRVHFGAKASKTLISDDAEEDAHPLAMLAQAMTKQRSEQQAKKPATAHAPRCASEHVMKEDTVSAGEGVACDWCECDVSGRVWHCSRCKTDMCAGCAVKQHTATQVICELDFFHSGLMCVCV